MNCVPNSVGCGQYFPNGCPQDSTCVQNSFCRCDNANAYFDTNTRQVRIGIFMEFSTSLVRRDMSFIFFFQSNFKNLSVSSRIRRHSIQQSIAMCSKFVTVLKCHDTQVLWHVPRYSVPQVMSARNRILLSLADQRHLLLCVDKISDVRQICIAWKVSMDRLPDAPVNQNLEVHNVSIESECGHVLFIWRNQRCWSQYENGPLGCWDMNLTATCMINGNEGYCVCNNGRRPPSCSIPGT